MKYSVSMFAVAAAASVLFFGCSKAENQSAEDKGVLSGVKNVASAVTDAASGAVDTVKDAAVAVADKTAEVAVAAKDATVDAAVAVKDATVAAGEKTAEVAGAAVAAVAGAAGIATAKEGTIRMITEATFPPYEFRQGKEVVGIDVEICKAIAKALGKELAIEDVEFDSVIPSLIAGKAELAAAGITVTEDRKMKVDFSHPYVRTGIVFIFAKDKPFDAEKAEEAKGKRVGVQNGTTSADYVREKLGQEPEMFDSPASAFAAMKAGKVDVVIADIDPAKAVIKGEPDYDISELLTVEEYAVAIKKGQPELLAVLNKVIDDLDASGKLDEIKDEWTAKAEAAAAAEEAAKPAEEAKAACACADCKDESCDKAACGCAK